MDGKSSADKTAAPSAEYLRTHTLGELKPLSAPLLLADYDPAWPRFFETEAYKIQTALGKIASQIEHVGSTAVPGLPAKPIVDILLTVPDSANENEYVSTLEAIGYNLRIREPEWHEHRMLEGSGKKINLHVFSAGCPEIERMLMFRNWLRTHESDRELYARVKRTLVEQKWKYVQDYADAKTSVVEEIIRRAQQ